MEPVEPVNFKPSASSAQPLTEEWYLQQKKLLRQAGMEPPTPAEARDVYTPSLEARPHLPKDKFEAFLQVAKNHILKMDRNSETFLPDATSKIVSTALEQEFGEKVAQDPGFPQMKATITRRILNDARYREMVEKFLELISLTSE